MPGTENIFFENLNGAITEYKSYKNEYESYNLKEKILNFPYFFKSKRVKNSIIKLIDYIPKFDYRKDDLIYLCSILLYKMRDDNLKELLNIERSIKYAGNRISYKYESWRIEFEFDKDGSNYKVRIGARDTSEIPFIINILKRDSEGNTIGVDSECITTEDYIKKTQPKSQEIISICIEEFLNRTKDVFLYLLEMEEEYGFKFNMSNPNE